MGKGSKSNNKKPLQIKENASSEVIKSAYLQLIKLQKVYKREERRPGFQSY